MEVIEEDRYNHSPEQMLAATPSLGAGYDSMSGALRSTAISSETVSGGSRGEVNLYVCKGIVETSKALKVDQSLALDFAGFVQVDQKLQFIRNSKATTETVSIVVYARKQVDSSTAQNPRPIEGLPDEPARFVKGYGDSYIESVERGGEYYAVYTFFTETKEQQQSLVTSLEAKGVRSGVTVKGSLQVAIDESVKSSRTEWTFQQAISGIRDPKLPDQDGLIAFALGFTGLTMDSPVVIGFTTAGYENVPGFAVDFSRIVANRRYFVGIGIDAGLARKAVDIGSLQNRVSWLQQIYRAYDYRGDEPLAAFAQELDRDRRAIHDQFVAYEDDPVRVFETPPLPSLEKGTPQLDYDRLTSDSWGRDGGKPFSFPGAYEAITNQTRIAWLRLRGGKYVDQLAIRYATVHGVGSELRFGREGGAEQISITFSPGEFVAQVNTRHGKFVDQLEIRTTDGQVTKIGRDGGDPSEWTVPEGCRVLGFQGRSDAYLDQIQVVYVRLKPAKFVK